MERPLLFAAAVVFLGAPVVRVAAAEDVFLLEDEAFLAAVPALFLVPPALFAAVACAVPARFLAVAAVPAVFLVRGGDGFFVLRRLSLREAGVGVAARFFAVFEAAGALLLLGPVPRGL